MLFFFFALNIIETRYRLRQLSHEVRFIIQDTTILQEMKKDERKRNAYQGNNPYAQGEQ
jgi:hypothetical protein